MFLLDAVAPPSYIIRTFLIQYWWIIAIAAGLVISAIIGIVYFTKKKRLKKENK